MFGKLGAVLEIGLLDRRFRLAFQDLADAFFRFGPALACAIHKPVDAGALFAGGRELVLHILGVLGRFRENLFGLRQFVGCLRTAGFGLGNIGEEGVALLLDLGGHAFERLELRFRLALALFKSADLALGIGRAKLPGVAFLRDGGEAAGALLRFAAKPFMFGACFRKFETQRRHLVAKLRGAGARLFVGLQVLQRDFRFFQRPGRFALVPGEALIGLRECGKPRKLRGSGTLGRRQRIADTVMLALGLAKCGAAGLFFLHRLLGGDMRGIESGTRLGSL